MFATHYDYNDLVKKNVLPPGFSQGDRLCQNCYNRIIHPMQCEEKGCDNPKIDNKYCGRHMKNWASKESQISMSAGTKKKIGIGILVIAGFFVILIGSVIAWQTLNPEELAKLRAEAAEREALETQKRLAEQAQKEKQQEITQIKTSTALPDSCRGVNSMELDIYPTGKQCFSALNDRVEEWCLSQSKDCVTQFYLKLADTCADPILSSVDVCLMYTFKELYPKLIP